MAPGSTSGPGAGHLGAALWRRRCCRATIAFLQPSDNSVECDPTAHAEIVAIRRAAAARRTYEEGVLRERVRALLAGYRGPIYNAGDPA